MSSPYLFEKRLIIRTPTLPLRRQEIDHESLLQDNFFLEAVYLASPVLYREIIKWKEGKAGNKAISNKKDYEKLMRSVHKYFLRMSSRCTPFGLFSGCAVGEWADEDVMPVLDSKNLTRHTRLDMHYLCALSRHLSERPDIRERLLFFPNNSLYLIGNELRFIEYVYELESRRYKVSSVTASEYLEKIIRFVSAGATIGQIVDSLIVDDISEKEAREFVAELINAQILVSEMEPAITGPEFMDQIIMILERIVPEDTVLRSLKEVQQTLKAIDDSPEEGIQRYQYILKILGDMGVAYDEGKLFQSDLVKTLRNGRVNSAVQEQIMEALAILNKLTLSKGDESIKNFAKKFMERYEGKEMPLMEVLDPEIGIGYEQSAANCIAPLVEDMQIMPGNREEQKLAWSKLEVFLNKKLEAAIKSNADVVELKEEELNGFPSDQDDLPPSFAVMFRMAGQNSVYIESAGGSSAVNLLGRFAHADPAIREVALDVARYEQEQDQGVVYAEIVHLPESRTGNILLHPAFRDYEIPYLAKTSLEKEFRLDINDLYVSVKRGVIILRSRRLKKQIIPRLSTAHNYAFNSLPVYRFLCDLQLQDKKSPLVFSWGALQSQYKHLPRVVYKNTILNLARWNFSKTDIDFLKDKSGEMAESRVEAFRDKWRLPRHVVLSEGDNELLIDLGSLQSVVLLLDSVKHKDSFILKEFIDPGNAMTDEDGASYSNQFLAVLLKKGSSYGGSRIDRFIEPSERTVTREFGLGSEWVYFKVYCGIKSADKVLLEAVLPITDELSEKELIHKWFFIRYNDPEFHIRLRFHLKDARDLGVLIGIVHSYFKVFEAQGYIWKLQTDIYRREIERYGSNTIGMAESIFYRDSVSCLQMLNNTNGDERETIRWIWALRAVEELLNCFDLDASEKLGLLQDLRDGFGAEFSLDKTAKNQLNDKYRSNRNIINSVMKEGTALSGEWQSLLEILAMKSMYIGPIAQEIISLNQGGKLEASFPGLLASYIHMMLNRIIPAEPRTHELVIYDFLCRYYKTQVVVGGIKPAMNDNSAANDVLI